MSPAPNDAGPRRGFLSWIEKRYLVKDLLSVPYLAFFWLMPLYSKIDPVKAVAERLRR